VNDSEYDHERQYTTRDFEIVDQCFAAFNAHVAVTVTLRDGTIIDNCFVTSVQDHDRLAVMFAAQAHGNRPGCMFVRTSADKIATIERISR
jgi:hypothetical protein